MTWRKALAILAFVPVLLVAGFFAYREVIIMRIPYMVSGPPITPPLDMTVRIPIASRDHLFGAFDRFARENGFSFNILWVEEEKDTMSASLRKDDVYLVVGNAFDREKFDVTLFPIDIAGTPPPDAADLEAKIRKALASVPNLVVLKDSKHQDRVPQPPQKR